MSNEAVTWAMEQRTAGPLDKLLLFIIADVSSDEAQTVIDLQELAIRCDTSCEEVEQAFIRLRRDGLMFGMVAGGAIMAKLTVSFTRDAPRQNNLKLRTIIAFRQTCEYCRMPGDATNGPDRSRWTLDRIVPGAKGGRYVAGNVTLSCSACNTTKATKPAPPGTRSLLDAEAKR